MNGRQVEEGSSWLVGKRDGTDADCRSTYTTVLLTLVPTLE